MNSPTEQSRHIVSPSSKSEGQVSHLAKLEHVAHEDWQAWQLKVSLSKNSVVEHPHEPSSFNSNESAHILHSLGPESHSRQLLPQLVQVSPSMYSLLAQERQIVSPRVKSLGHVSHLSPLRQVSHDSWQLPHWSD